MGISRGYRERYRGDRYTGTLIEWTPERLQFFVNVQIALNHIIWSLHDLTDEDKLIAVADSGKFLMGAVHGQKEIGSGEEQA